VAFVRNLPIAALALPAGLLADRVNRRHLMVATDGVRALSMAAIPIAAATARVPYALILVVAAIDGTGYVLSNVAERGALRHLVAPEQLGDAVARNESRTFGAMLAGPPLGGLLFGIGRVLPFLADAGSYAISTISKLRIRSDLQEARLDGPAGDAREGLRWLWQWPFMRNCMLLFAGSNPIFTGLYLLVVLLARRHGASSALIGVMLGIAAAGGLLGALLAPSLQRRLTARVALVGESWVLALSIPLLLVARDPLLIGAILAAAELITPVTNSFVVSFRVAFAPDRLQGRVQAASTLVSLSAGWLGPLAVGLLVQSAGDNVTILVLTGWALMLALAATGSRAFRRPPGLDAPGAPSVAAAS
jgi:predicted MFS family arabinose efflux permease